jgi:hypothetical protein
MALILTYIHTYIRLSFPIKKQGWKERDLTNVIFLLVKQTSTTYIDWYNDKKNKNTNKKCTLHTHIHMYMFNLLDLTKFRGKRREKKKKEIFRGKQNYTTQRSIKYRWTWNERMNNPRFNFVFSSFCLWGSKITEWVMSISSTKMYPKKIEKFTHFL